MPPSPVPTADFRERVRASFDRQRFMATLGARLVRVEPGEVEIALAFRDTLTQQHGFLHAGALASVLDSACGYAAFTLMPADAGVLSVEFKLDLLAPAAGDEFVARARVIKPGRTLSVTRAEGFMRSAGAEKLVATLGGTMMCLREREIAG